MNAIEMRKYAFTCMVENNKDETIKTLIKYDNENNKLIHENSNLRDEILDLNEIIDKAIEYVEKEFIDDEIEYTARLLDILKGADIKEIPLFEGTLKQLDKLSIRK